MQNHWTTRHALSVTATAPVLAAIAGSTFNIWYNISQVQPLLTAEQLTLFLRSIFYYNVTAYPVLVTIWVSSVFSIRKPMLAILNGDTVDQESLAKARVRTINLPWHIGAVVALGWMLCIPALLFGLQRSSQPIDQRVLFHLPTSVIIAALISITLAFFIVELITERVLFPVLFQNTSPSRTQGAVSLPLNRRNLLNAIAACVCPILSLVLLAFVEVDRMDDLN
ncbi:MAG: hypothetical protein VB858_15910, partial [Planctomycetaceae bacterium]